MNNLSVDYYVEKLNRIPVEANEILNSIRVVDKQILKLQIDINMKRKQVISMITQYQKIKVSFSIKAKQKNDVKSHKMSQKIRKADQNNQNQEKLKINKGNSHIDRQSQSGELKLKISEMMKNIEQIHQQMLKLSKKKIQDSTILYNYIDEPTEELQRDLAKYQSNEQVAEKKELKHRRNKHEHEQQYLPSEPCYCYCNRPSFGQMVQCNNLTCANQWFHLQCIDEREDDLKGEWFCRDCKKKGVKTRHR